MSYKHITKDQRNELSILLRTGFKQKEIALALNKSSSAISQELKRNRCNNKYGYNAYLAKVNTRNRRIKANSRFKKLDNSKWLRGYVDRKLKLKWSPEQISGRLKIEYPLEKDKHIGKDSIYKYIYQERKDLVKHLRCQKGGFRRRYGTRIREKRREELKKKRIDKRPKEVEIKERLGDWEGDTIVGKEKNIHILTHVDRKSGILFADKLNKATAEMTKVKTIERFKKIPKSKKHTITYDNGNTFAYHEVIERYVGMNIYFAWPYHSWERGCNENTNGLLRQFFPKGSPFVNIQQEDIERVVRLINNRPRKRLNYLTPSEVFYTN